MEKLKSGFATLQKFSAFLLVGTVIALIWANTDVHGYEHFIEGRLISPETLDAWEASGGLWATLAHVYEWFAHILAHDPATSAGIKQWAEEHQAADVPHPFSFHFVVNDLFMVLFFGIAAKEVSESFLPGGALSSFQKAAMPAVATLGGVLGPVATFFILHAILAPEPAVTRAWAVPTATDIAYCWLFAQLIFGEKHPAVTFLLVLAVLDDLIGMMIIAVFYTEEVHLAWLGLVVAGVVWCEAMRRLRVTSFWPYVIVGGTLCWFGLHNTGVHAALALVPVVPFMPHAERDAGLFTSRRADHEEAHSHDGHDDAHAHHEDTLNDFEHFFKPIVDVGLITFGIANAGVVISGQSLGGSPTWIIFCSLLFGKTIGIFLFALIGQRVMGLSLPKPMTMKQIIPLGAVAGIGFTVALFVTTVALSSGEAATLEAFKASGTGDMLKLGALLSFAAGPIAFIISRVINLERVNTSDELKAAIANMEAETAG
ncbi:MAG: Na+/H+ antiporter NhaA [Myxococcota bacterium]